MVTILQISMENLLLSLEGWKELHIELLDPKTTVM